MPKPKPSEFPYLELSDWKVGRVLSEHDIANLEEFRKQYAEDLDSWADEAIRAQDDVLREIGGESLRVAYRAKHAAQISKILHECLAKYHQSRKDEVAKGH